MAGCCHDHACSAGQAASPRYRKILYWALALNLAMFVVEIGGGLHAGSVSLLADAVDFAGDAANYGISLAVLSMASVWRSRAALIKGLSMGIFGLVVLVKTGYALVVGGVPEPYTMGGIALAALAVNVLVALLLYAYREGDANMRSVWLCSRNDAIGNVAVAGAAVAVSVTGAGWPDALVALAMAGLALSAGVSVVRHARHELAHAA